MGKRGDKRIRTFADLNKGDSDTDDEEKNVFTGGEKSALEVEKPPKNDAQHLVRDLLTSAEEAAKNGGYDTEEEGSSSGFFGGGYRLGTEEGESERIGTSSNKPLEKVKKTCTFWKDGFSIGDGPLYRYDNPANAQYLEQMKQGSAPISLFNIKPGQRVDIDIKTKSTQNYKPPATQAARFSGTGFRLGSPVPGEVAVEEESSSSTTADKAKIEPETQEPKDPKPNAGQTVIQVRLADGRKLRAIVEKQGPVQQLFSFVDSVIADTREYYLSLSFPVKPIENKEQSISDAKLAQTVVIQRWK